MSRKNDLDQRYDSEYAYARWLHYVMVKYDGRSTAELEERFTRMVMRMNRIPAIVFIVGVIVGFIFAYNSEAFNDPTDPLVMNMFICIMVAFLSGIIPAVITSSILERPARAIEYDELCTELDRREYLRQCRSNLAEKCAACMAEQSRK